MLDVSKPDLLQLIDVIAPEIFPKLYCIPLLMTCQLINNNWHNLCFHSPYFRDFDLKVFDFEIFSVTFVEVFWSDGTDTSISLQHRLAGSLITTYIRHVR